MYNNSLIIDRINSNYNNKSYKKIDYDLSNMTNSYSSLSKTYTPIQQRTYTPIQQRAINWGSDTLVSSEPRAYIEPSQADVEKVLEAIHMVEKLPTDVQRQLIEATREIRYFIDGQIRARFGATYHFNAIRCLNDPQTTEVNRLLSLRNVQLAGEEFFALNRFMINFPDIADVQWWALYQNGSWHLDTWNPDGEHLDTGVNGWGNLLGSVLKVNGKVLEPKEVIAFYRTILLRNERGFRTNSPLNRLQTILRLVDSGTLPRGLDEQLEELGDLSLVDSSGKVLTYAGKSMITPVKAIERRRRQETETDEEVKRIIHPIIFN